jgi:hypothetical protein
MHFRLGEQKKKELLATSKSNRGKGLGEMGLGRLEPEAAQGPETTEDGPQGHRRSTTESHAYPACAKQAESRQETV